MYTQNIDQGFSMFFASRSKATDASSSPSAIGLFSSVTLAAG